MVVRDFHIAEVLEDIIRQLKKDKMKFGIRKPSFKKRISARTSWKRVARHRMGVKAPRGMGFIINPKKAIYNRTYNRTSMSVGKLLKKIF